MSDSLSWYRNTLLLLVGPGSEKELPEGKTLEDVLKDFQPDVYEWSVLAKTKTSLKPPVGVASASEWQEFPQGQRDLEKWEKFIKVTRN